MRTQRDTVTFAEYIQERVRLEVVRHEKLNRSGTVSRWLTIAVYPAQITLCMCQFPGWPEVIEGEVDGHTYRATPTVSQDQRYVTFELEVLL